MIVFFANATGTDLPYGLLAVVLLSNTLLSIGAPGVPNSAIASFAALAAIAGLPAGIMGMYVSVNILGAGGYRQRGGHEKNMQTASVRRI